MRLEVERRQNALVVAQHETPAQYGQLLRELRGVELLQSAQLLCRLESLHAEPERALAQIPRSVSARLIGSNGFMITSSAPSCR